MDIKALLNPTGIGSKSNFIAVQFISNGKQQFYIVANRAGQQNIVLGWEEVSPMIKDSNNVTIININQLDEELNGQITQKIQDYYISIMNIQ